MEFTKNLLTIEDPGNLHLCFELDKKIYALNAKNVLEVTSLPMINEPQRLPAYIVGILNYNDLFINVIDIRKVFDLQIKNYELSDKIIIIKGEESLFAVIVDEVTDFFNANPVNIQRVMGDCSNNIVQSFYKIDENIINIVDISSLERIVKSSMSQEKTTDYSMLFPQDEESQFILQKRRNAIAKTPIMNLEADIYSKDQYVVFRLAEHMYCLYSYYIKELISLKNYQLTKIPYTPEYLIGIINLKGSFYTVLDLKKFIGFETKNKSRTPENGKVIVIDSTELKLALWVDDIVDIINIAKENIETKNDQQLDSLFIKAEAYINKDVYNILNLDKLINDERLYINNSI